MEYWKTQHKVDWDAATAKQVKTNYVYGDKLCMEEDHLPTLNTITPNNLTINFNVTFIMHLPLSHHVYFNNGFS